MTTENNDSTKAADEEIPELSTDELSNIISEEDPEFAASMEGLKDENFDIAGDDGSIPIDFNAQVKDFKTKFQEARQKFKADLRKVKFWSLKRKLILFFIIFAIPGLGFYFTYIYKKNFIHPDTQIYLNSVGEWADHTYTWDPDSDGDREVFYNSLRLPLYVYNMKKLIVNLKTSSRSASNAMIALELVTEGTTPEVVTEVKEKESFYRDVFQQELSQMSYENLVEPEGKSKMLERLRRVANETLTQGKIKKIYIKNIILKN